MKTTTKTRTPPFSFACLGVFMMLFSITGHALVLNTTTPSGTFNWEEIVNGFTLMGNGSVTVSGFNTHQFILDFMLNNTTTPSGTDDKTTLYAFGFGIDPNATGVTFSDSSYAMIGETSTGMSDAGMVTKAGSTNFTGHPIANIEVCAFSANNCSGFGNVIGIAAGNFDAFRLTLDGKWGSVVTLNPIAMEYKAGSVVAVATDPTPLVRAPIPAPPSSVPEPQSLILLGMGLIASVFASRRNPLQCAALWA